MSQARLIELMTGGTPWTVTATSGNNASAAATKAAVSGVNHYVTGYLVVLRGATAANDAVVTIKDDSTVKITECIGTSQAIGTRISNQLTIPLKITTNKAASLNVAAAGAGCITELTLFGYTL